MSTNINKIDSSSNSGNYDSTVDLKQQKAEISIFDKKIKSSGKNSDGSYKDTVSLDDFGARKFKEIIDFVKTHTGNWTDALIDEAKKLIKNFKKNGNMENTVLADKNGYVPSQYDASGRVVELMNNQGIIKTITYNEENQTKTESLKDRDGKFIPINKNGDKISVTYDQNNKIVGYTDLSGRVAEFNDKGDILSISELIDGNKIKTNFEYDDNGKMTTFTIIKTNDKTNEMNKETYSVLNQNVKYENWGEIRLETIEAQSQTDKNKKIMLEFTNGIKKRETITKDIGSHYEKTEDTNFYSNGNIQNKQLTSKNFCGGTFYEYYSNGVLKTFIDDGADKNVKKFDEQGRVIYEEKLFNNRYDKSKVWYKYDSEGNKIQTKDEYWRIEGDAQWHKKGENGKKLY